MNLRNAVMYNDEAAVRRCLENGEDPNVVYLGTSTLLHLVAHEGTLEIAKMMVKYGACVHVRDNGLSNALDYAIHNETKQGLQMTLFFASLGSTANHYKHQRNYDAYIKTQILLALCIPVSCPRADKKHWFSTNTLTKLKSFMTDCALYVWT